MHLGERPLKVFDQLGEAPFYRALPRDQNIIIALHRMRRSGEPHRFFKPPPRAIAHDRAPETFGRSKAETRELRFGAVAPACLQHQRRRDVARAPPYMQEFFAGLETSDRDHR